MKPKRRVVLASPRLPLRGRPRAWAFGYADFAAALGVSERTVRRWVHGTAARPARFDPGDLQSLLALHRQLHP